MVSSEVAQDERAAWPVAGALHSLLCPFFLPERPPPLQPLCRPLRNVGLAAADKRPLRELILEVIANLVPFMVSVELGYFPPMCFTLLLATLNVSCHLTAATQPWELLLWLNRGSLLLAVMKPNNSLLQNRTWSQLSHVAEQLPLPSKAPPRV